MKTKTILLISFALAAVAAPLARAQIDITAEIRLGHRAPPPPPDVVVVVADNGPSPWAQTHWYQTNQDYYYYPGTDVYYRVSDHVWFYNDHGSWHNGPFLPPYIRVDFGRSVPLRMATNRPYHFHEQIVARYPSNYFETRVRFHDDHRDYRHDDHHDDHRDHDDHR